MKTHNVSIFHCLTCGNVVYADVSVRPPECCGYQMVRAAAETICEADFPEKAVTGCPEAAPPGAMVPIRPR